MPLQLIHWVIKGFVQLQIAVLDIPDQQPLSFQMMLPMGIWALHGATTALDAVSPSLFLATVTEATSIALMVVPRRQIVSAVGGIPDAISAALLTVKYKPSTSKVSEERELLDGIVHRGNHAAMRRRHAQILLLVDEG